MIDSTTLITYLLAAIAIVIAPGPAQALVLARTMSLGKRAGIVTAVGLNVGTLVHTIAAALGLSTILATSAVAFAVVKYVGAAYLIYLGIQALRHKEQPADANAPSKQSSTQVMSKALITGILNPKVALFFLAFLPQFIDPQRGSVFAQFLILGGLLALVDIVYESLLVLVFHALSSRITQNPRFALWRERITGMVLIGLGVRLAFVQRE